MPIQAHHRVSQSYFIFPILFYKTIVNGTDNAHAHADCYSLTEAAVSPGLHDSAPSMLLVQLVNEMSGYFCIQYVLTHTIRLLKDAQLGGDQINSWDTDFSNKHKALSQRIVCREAAVLLAVFSVQ